MQIYKDLKSQQTKIWLGLTSLSCFIAIMLAVLAKSSVIAYDLKIISYLPYLRIPALTGFFHYVSWFSDWPAMLVLVIVAGGLLLSQKQKVTAAVLAVAFTLEEIITANLKRLVARPRIEPALSLVKETSFSFPSGHVLRAVVVFGFLAYLAARSDKPAWVKNMMVASCMSVIVLVSLSRLYLGAHYPSDVFASLFLGSSLLALLIGVMNNRAKHS